MKEKNVGIIGGMGPQATIDFANKIISHTKATIDQDHIEMLIYNDPKIPNRIDSISGKGENIAPVLIRNAQKLIEFGADFLVLPCNTAHYYYDEIKKNIDKPFLNIIDESIQYLHTSNIDKIGVIGTKPTVELGLYQNKWRALGHQCVNHSGKIQEITEKIIAGVKANNTCCIDQEEQMYFFDFFLKSKINALVMACTELPVYFSKKDSPIKLIDPTLILALKTIEFAGYEVR